MSEGIRKSLLADMQKRGESLSQHRDFIRQIERVAPNYPYYYIDEDNKEVPFPKIYKVLDVMEAEAKQNLSPEEKEDAE